MIGRLSWNNQKPKCTHEGPYKWQRGRRRRRDKKVVRKMQHETQPAIAAFEMDEQASSQVMREPPEARKGKEVNFSPRASKRNAALLTMIFHHWDLFRTSDFQNYKITNLCYFKPPRLWQLLIAPIEMYTGRNNFFLQSGKSPFSINSWPPVAMTTVQHNVYGPPSNCTPAPSSGFLLCHVSKHYNGRYRFHSCSLLLNTL